MAIQKILVPDMGDFKDVEVIEVLVKEGQVIKKNDSLILTAKQIFKHRKNLNTESSKINTTMKKNSSDIRDNIDYYNTLKQQIDILERKSNDKTPDGLMEDAILKEKSSY